MDEDRSVCDATSSARSLNSATVHNDNNSSAPAAQQYRHPSLSKYSQLLAVIEDMGRDVRPTYSGSKSSAERLKRGIGHARILVRECLIETERTAKS